MNLERPKSGYEEKEVEILVNSSNVSQMSFTLGVQPRDIGWFEGRKLRQGERIILEGGEFIVTEVHSHGVFEVTFIKGIYEVGLPYTESRPVNIKVLDPEPSRQRNSPGSGSGSRSRSRRTSPRPRSRSQSGHLGHHR